MDARADRAQSSALERQRALLEAAQGPVLAGSFSAAIAHDINNVLGVARAGIDGLERSKDEDRRERALALLRRSINDFARIVERMSRLGARQESPVRVLDDLAEIVRETTTSVAGTRRSAAAACR